MNRIGLVSGAAFLQGVTLPMGLRVDELIVKGGMIQAEWPPLNVEAAEPGFVEANVTAESLAAFVAEQAKGDLANVQIALEGDRVILSATAKAIFPTRAEFSLRIEEGRRVYLQLEDAAPGLARPFIEAKLRELNPLGGEIRLPVDFEIQEIRCAEGWLRAKLRVGG